MENQSIDNLIEQLTNVTYGSGVEAREKHVFKEAVLGLIRLARAEQIRDMKIDVAQLMCAPHHDLHSYSEVD
ncbi:hypothetical protein Q8A64_05300 [Oxalobacteraceae bacterium R-40]|jgi:hypothetical protein|uniref:Uncharacterized protein n=1 Tax=Keguizhuia sedimenti TaxID=3064264 RepID=A0ABU1BLW7_9BURK|nr:hypothetical protein [Oxalobacteraceae bacterium R-40]